MKTFNDLLDELYYSLEPIPLQYSKAVNKKLELYEKICELLDEEGKKLLFDYDGANGTHMSDACADDFKRGYRLCFRHVFVMLLCD